MKLAARTACAFLLLPLAFAPPGASASQSAPPKAGAESQQDGQAGSPKTKPKPRPQKVKAVLREVDLDHRSITIIPLDQAASGVGQRPRKADLAKLELRFPPPAGSEVIKLSKKAANALGKKGVKEIPLEELKAGAQLRVEYDPAAGEIIEVVVEQAAF